MQILITGGTGFIGSHITKKLIHEGHSISVIKNPQSNLWRLKEIEHKINFIDNTDAELEKGFNTYHFDCIVHLAALLKVNDENLINIMELNESNINFGIKILNLAIKYNTKKIINTGSFFEEELHESNKPVPHNYYAVTKIMFEEVLKYFTYKYGLQSITLRLFTPYGENDNEDKIIPQIIKSLLNNDKLQVKNKNQELNFIYIDDIVNAYVYSIEKLRNTQEPYYQKFDIGNTDSYSIPQIIFTLQQISGLDGKFSFSEQNQKNYLYKNCNLSYTKENLGWEPLVPIEEGLKKTWLSYLGKKNKNEK